jgi:hypothetical protein
MGHQRFIRGSLFCLILTLLLTSALFVSSAKRRAAPDTLPSELDVRVPGGVLSRGGRAVPPPAGAKGASRASSRAPDAAQAKALAALEQAAGGRLSVRYNALTGTPRHMFATAGYLSPPSASPPERVAQEFVRRWQGLFRFSEGDVRNLRLKSRATIPDMGVTVLLFEQTAGGLPVYKGEVLVNVNREGQIINVGGDSYPQLKVTNSLALTPAEAVSAAAAALGFEVLSPVEASE